MNRNYDYCYYCNNFSRKARDSLTLNICLLLLKKFVRIVMYRTVTRRQYEQCSERCQLGITGTKILHPSLKIKSCLRPDRGEIINAVSRFPSVGDFYVSSDPRH